MFSPDDERFMRMALAQAEAALYLTSPNPRVGCVLVKDGAVIGAGHTQRAGGPHAEVMALRAAREAGHDISGATAYVTLEPCNHFGRTPPCSMALLEAGVTRVIAAVEDPHPAAHGGLARLREAGVEVRCGLLRDEATEINRGFLRRVQGGLPWVRVKAAVSLDGRTALANGVSQWITGEAARADGHHWRARACAVLSGIGTIRKDDAQLNVRAVDTPRQPRRILVDSRLEVSLQAKLLHSHGGPVTVLHVSRDADKEAELRDRGVQLIQVPEAANKPGKVDLRAAIQALADEGLNEIHVEGGGKLNGSLIAAGVVDELLVYVAPRLLGEGPGIAEQPAYALLGDAPQLQLHAAQVIGEDVRILARFRPQRG
jgi:diaminohydroxyphosphoribosylaminopyrimidine deaminase/5-amino-6-(5-phosphoribosylamino)uracil reductase